MLIGVAAETDPTETRVAASPETVKKFAALGADVAVEHGAGVTAGVSDADYQAAGARLVPAAEALGADLVLKVRRPTEGELAHMKRGAIVVATMDPYGHEDAIEAMARAGVSAFAMELMPRITRAQVMDVLSSQANLAGYRAVIDAAAEYGRAMPMMMTPAGTVPAARLFVMGVGVAGLQAIATGRRLGAVVTATDVRPATKEQVEIARREIRRRRGRGVQAGGDRWRLRQGNVGRIQGEAGRAGRLAHRQTGHRRDDGVDPGRPAPRLVTAEMVRSMRAGSVIVDIAVERGGNCELSKAGETVTTDNGVKIVGYSNVTRLAATASALYARNLYAFVETLVDKANKALAVDRNDELVKATCLTRDGAIVHPNFQPK